MITTNFNHQTKTLETMYLGNVTLDQIVDYINETSVNTSYPRQLKILTDATEGNLILEPSDIGAIVEANNNSLKNYESITDALIVTNPNDTALTLFFRHLMNNPKYQVQAFSTQKAAITWLDHVELP